MHTKVRSAYISYVMETKLNKCSILSIEGLSKKKKIPIIENFIISNNHTGNVQVGLNHPCILEGVSFMLCVEGKGKIKLNFKEYAIEKNMIFCVFPGCIFEFLEQSEDFNIEFLITSFDFISELRIPVALDIVPKYDQYICLKVNEEELRILMEFYTFIVYHYNRVDHLYRVDMGKNLLAALMIEFLNIYRKSTDVTLPAISHKEKMFKIFFRLMRKHHKKNRYVAFYADKMCVTPTYVNKVVKEVSGKTANEWINGMTINTIKAYLKSSTLTVLQISEELNFPNPSFFGRYFKKHTGLTPLQYRKGP